MDAIIAKVTIDLSPIEDDRTTLDGKVLFDHNDQPDELELDLTGASAATLNNLFGGAGLSLLDGQSIDATLEDGRLLKSSIALAHGCTPTHTGSITLRARLGPATITDSRSASTGFSRRSEKSCRKSTTLVKTSPFNCDSTISPPTSGV